MHVQILLKIDHVDVAERDLKNTSKIDDNATLAQITTAWVGVVVDPFATHCAGHAHMLYAKLALGNLVACLPHVGQSPDLVERYEAQLTSVASQHGWVANVTAAATSFDRAVEMMES